MSGHNKYSQIKHRKEAQDSKKSIVFSKLLAAIAVAAKQNPKPDANPRLRSAIEKAKENKVPLDNIERAISKASEEKDLAELLIETYGPEGVGILIEAITDNSNRTTSEIRHLLDENGAKMATPGSVLWSFEQIVDERGMDADLRGKWHSKFSQPISDTGKQKLRELVSKLEEREDVQRVTTNAISN